LHGHRYVIEISLSGEIIDTEGAAMQGMVMDFSEVKNIANTVLVSRWDHAFLVYQGDREVVDFLATLAGHKTVVLPVVPTAENLANEAFPSSTQPTSTAMATSCGCSGCGCTKPPTTGPTPSAKPLSTGATC